MMEIGDNQLVIEPIQHLQDFEACLALQQQTWAMPDRGLVPSHVLITVQDIGGLVLGAWLGSELVGFTFGFCGLTAGGYRYHHSHMTAVAPEYRSRGIGLALKLEQARRVKNQDIDLITWTFDPLEARNAYFNLTRLGAISRRYHINRYGTMSDGLNAGIASDRIEVDWWLNSEYVTSLLDYASQSRQNRPVSVSEVFLLTARWRDGVASPADNILIPETGSFAYEVPGDFQGIKRSDMGLANRWRMAVRGLFLQAFSAGFATTRLIRLEIPSEDISFPRTFYKFESLSENPGLERKA